MWQNTQYLIFTTDLSIGLQVLWYWEYCAAVGRSQSSKIKVSLGWAFWAGRTNTVDHVLAFLIPNNVPNLKTALHFIRYYITKCLIILFLLLLCVICAKKFVIFNVENNEGRPFVFEVMTKQPNIYRCGVCGFSHLYHKNSQNLVAPLISSLGSRIIQIFMDSFFKAHNQTNANIYY